MEDKRNMKHISIKEQLGQVNIRESSILGVFQMLRSLIPSSTALHSHSSAGLSHHGEGAALHSSQMEIARTVT